MNEARQYEETIDLLSLMVKALRKWPVLLAAMLIGAVLIGGYKGLVPVDNTSAIAAGQKQIEDLQKQIDSVQAQIETTETKRYERLKTCRANERAIEANEWTIEKNKKKITEDKEMLPVLKDELAQWEEVLASMESSLKESQDLLTSPSLTAVQRAELAVQVNALTGDVLNGRAQVKSSEQKIPDTEMEIEDLEREIETLEHDIEDILEDNKVLREQIDKDETKIIEQEAESDEQEAEIGELEAEIGELEAQIAGLSDTRVRPKTVLKYAILGAAMGAFIFCGVIFLQFILDHSLRASGELKERYNFPILGEFRSEAAKKHGRLGQWLDKLCGDVQTLPEEQQVYELIAAGVRTSAAAQPLQLAVTGTVSKDVLDRVGGQLRSLLPDTYEIKVESNPVYNAAFLADLKQYTVLLVEAKGVSDKREIERLAEVLYCNEVKVIGAVVK